MDQGLKIVWGAMTVLWCVACVHDLFLNPDSSRLTAALFLLNYAIYRTFCHEHK